MKNWWYSILFAVLFIFGCFLIDYDYNKAHYLFHSTPKPPPPTMTLPSVDTLNLVVANHDLVPYTIVYPHSGDTVNGASSFTLLPGTDYIFVPVPKQRNWSAIQVVPLSK